MLLVLAGGDGCTELARYLVSNHRFTARTALPRDVSPGARVVVVPDKPLTTRGAAAMRRKVAKLDGYVVWLVSNAIAAEVSLPSPVSASMKPLEADQRRQTSIHELDRLVRVVDGLEGRK